MKHIQIVKTLCLFIGGYFLVSLILTVSYLLFPSASNGMLIFGGLLGLVMAYAYFKVFNIAEKLPRKQGVGVLCGLVLVFVALQVMINYYIAQNTLITPVIEAARIMTITFAEDVYIVSLVLGGLYLGYKPER